MQIHKNIQNWPPGDICGKGWTIRYLMWKLCEFLVLYSSMQDFFLKTSKLHRYKSSLKVELHEQQNCCNLQ